MACIPFQIAQRNLLVLQLTQPPLIYRRVIFALKQCKYYALLYACRQTSFDWNVKNAVIVVIFKSPE